MSDDLGFSDLGCYGGEIATPHLDGLASDGLRFSHFYNTSRCCPSRASLMTGKYQHTAEMGWMTAVDEQRDGYRGQLSFDHPTLPELLHEKGYFTCMAGKWHLTLDTNYRNSEEIPNGSWPTQRGFDEFYGGLSGGGSYYRPDSLARNLTRIPGESLPSDYYYTDAITQNAVHFVQTYDTRQPLFMYVAYYAPHRPLQAPAEKVAKCRVNYADGYDVLRKARFDRQQELGLFSKDLVLGKPCMRMTDDSLAWKELDGQQQRNWIDEMAAYAAMVEIMDEGIGAILAALKERGQLDNTYIVFLSDNGATKEGGLVSQLAADLSNTPFRNYKQYTHLGGVASPFIIRAPESNGGEICDEIGHINDLLPTCLEIAGATYPDRFRGKTLSPPDGVSLAGAIDGRAVPDRELYWEHQSSRAIQQGNWRLVSLDLGSPWELYDLSSDQFEQRDLAPSIPARVAELSQAWQLWAETHSVLPLENRPWNDRIRYYRDRAPNAEN